MNPTKWAIIGAIVIVIAMAFIADRGKSFAPDPAPTQAPANVAVADTAAPEPTAAPTPKPDMHAAREVAQAYWKRALGHMFAINIMRLAMQENVQGGDLPAASHNTDQGAEASVEAANDLQDGMPDGWDDVKENLSNSFASFNVAFQKTHDAIDSPLPSKIAEAQRTSHGADGYFTAAVQAARDHYVSMGGKASDISSEANI